MKIDEILTEAKARIEHPEDRIFDEGIKGAKGALKSLFDAISSAKNISVKFDGTPALIAGRIDGKFVLTDKVGLAKQKYAHTANEMYNMIFSRKPDQAGRRDYANKLAGIFKPLEQMIPPKFPYLIQFDVMWFETPKVNQKNNTVEFQPNKVLYSIPLTSDLGEQISNSQYGIVVHSFYAKPTDDESRAISDFHSLGLRTVPGMIVLNPKATFEVKPATRLSKQIVGVARTISSSSNLINSFLNPKKLEKAGAKELPKLMKQFLAARARIGKESVDGLKSDFIPWLEQSSSVSDKKKPFIISYIQKNPDGFDQIWKIVAQIVSIKYKVLEKLDKLNGSIQASINGVTSHEGYVVDAPSGKIKLVNRPLFMNDTTIGRFSPSSSSSVPAEQ